MTLVSDIIVGIWGILVLSLQLFLPIALSTLLILFIFNHIQRVTKTKWIAGATLTLFIVFSAFFFLLHVWNIANGLAETDAGMIPDDIAEQSGYSQSIPDAPILVLQALVQSLITGGIVALLLLPFAFLGVAWFDFLRKRFPGFWSRFAIVCLTGSIFLVVLILAFPWIPVSLVYLAFFGL